MQKMIVCCVKVNRARNSQEALDATCRKQYVNSDILATAPMGQGEEVDVYFFDLDYDPTTRELAYEYDVRRLVPDFAAQVAVNEEEPAFADDRPNCLQWGLDENGFASFAVFGRWLDGREVDVLRHDARRWDRHCRFGGVRI